MYCCINVNERLTYCRCLYYGKCKLTKVYTFVNGHMFPILYILLLFKNQQVYELCYRSWNCVADN